MGETRVIGVADIDLEVTAGELVILKGNSGSGKSTLLSLMAGLDRATTGTLSVAGVDLVDAARGGLTRFRRDVVGMVFQSFNLLPTLSVIENVCLPGLLAGSDRRSIHQHAMELLDWLDLGQRLHHVPAQLSGGEMQRTAIARALINDPMVILADEPTGNLDSRNGQIVMELMAELNSRWKCTVIIATHSSLADPVATRTIFLKDGRINNRP